MLYNMIFLNYSLHANNVLFINKIYVVYDTM